MRQSSETSPTSDLSEPSLAQRSCIFVFLEIFEREGGIQSYVRDIFQAYLSQPDLPQAEIFLLRDGIDCPNPFQSTRLNFRYFKSQSLALGRVRLAIALLTQLISSRPQRVYCGHIKLARLVRMLCQPLGIPYTVLTYGKEVWECLPESDRNALKAAEQIWTISRYTRDRACEANHLDPKKVVFLPCAVDGNTFTPGQKSPELVQRYGLANSRVLVTVARLWSGDIYKGVDVTIRALPMIAQAYPDVKYLVIGRGDDQPRLANLANELEVGDRVVFAGFVPTDDLVEHYRLADAYVMPSQEGFGIVYLEAMACGVPVLAGDADGSADPLQDGRLGWQVPYRDPMAVAKACIEILAGDDQRCDGAWLRQNALSSFGKESFAHQLHQLIQGV
jgi:glycosyltransferase involved in cell wall biosynthesis